MNKKLFLVCPDCHLEHFIKVNYGEDAFFLTALGAVFNFSETQYTEAILDLINRECINEIFVVNDTSCRFINSALEEESGYGTLCESAIQNILTDNYSIIMNDKSLIEKKKHLEELNVKEQVKEIFTNEKFAPEIFQKNISVKGLVLTKEEKSVKECGFV